MNNLRKKLKKIPALKLGVIALRQFRNPHNIFEKVRGLTSYLSDFQKYQKLPANSAVPATTANLYPCIYDKTSDTPLDPVYFFQDAWCAKKVFESKPKHHYDIASQAHMVGIISQFVPTTMIDIRPIPLTLPGLSFIKGDVNNLPFKDGEIASLSSICVVEHIGLGRYGDALDPFGTEKALAEMIRVLAPGGNLYISVPIDEANRVYFNAHRAFTRDYIVSLCSPLSLVEEKYIYGNNMESAYDSKKGFGTGLFHFRKN